MVSNCESLVHLSSVEELISKLQAQMFNCKGLGGPTCCIAPA